MSQHERIKVIQLLDTIFQKEDTIEMITAQNYIEPYIAYDFFEDLYDILDRFLYSEKYLCLRISALFEQEFQKVI